MHRGRAITNCRLLSRVDQLKLPVAIIFEVATGDFKQCLCIMSQVAEIGFKFMTPETVLNEDNRRSDVLLMSFYLLNEKNLLFC